MSYFRGLCHRVGAWLRRPALAAHRRRRDGWSGEPVPLDALMARLERMA